MVRASLTMCLADVLVGRLCFFNARRFTTLPGRLRILRRGKGLRVADVRLAALAEKQCPRQHQRNRGDLRTIQQPMQQGAAALRIAPELSEVNGSAGREKPEAGNVSLLAPRRQPDQKRNGNGKKSECGIRLDRVQRNAQCRNRSRLTARPTARTPGRAPGAQPPHRRCCTEAYAAIVQRLPPRQARTANRRLQAADDESSRG